MLKAGLCYEAMIDMTGLPFEKIYFRDEETQELIRWGGVGCTHWWTHPWVDPAVALEMN